MDLVPFVTNALSFLTVASQLAIGALVALAVAARRHRHPAAAARAIGRHAVTLALTVALIATAGSLFYSEVAGYEPCKLCWFQRIAMYPEVLLLGMARWRADAGIAPYTIALALIGAPIAAYHYLLQIGAAPALSCSAVGYSAACSRTFVLHFGYITIPLMALTAFLLIALLMVQRLLHDRRPHGP